MDARHVDGDLYRDGYFIGSAAAGDLADRFNANQSRLQFKVQHGKVTVYLKSMLTQVKVTKSSLTLLVSVSVTRSSSGTTG